MPLLHLIHHHFGRAARTLRKSAGTSLLAIAALALGIALTTTMFSLVAGLLMGRLPFADAERYMYVGSTHPERNRPPLVSPADFLDWRDAQSSFEAFVPFANRAVNLSDEIGFPERRQACFTSHEFFAAVPVEPHLGRVFSAAEDTPGAAAVAVIGHDLWIRRFQGDPEILGRVIRVEGESTKIVGVMPPGFRFPLREEIWLPLQLDPSHRERGRVERGGGSRSGPGLRIFGRLREGVSRRAAGSELAAIAARLAAEYPDTHAGRGASVQPYTERFMWPELRQMLWITLALIGLGLATACVNLAGLLMARVMRRSRELATVAALGASRGQVMAYVMAESLLLALLGAAGGVLAARLGVAYLAARIAWMPLPFWMEIVLDLRALGFAAAVTCAVALVGLVPALLASRTGLSPLLRGARSGPGLTLRRFTRILVVTEVAIAAVLVICAGLFVRSLRRLGDLDLGIDLDAVYTARLTLPGADYPEPADRSAFAERLAAALASHPDVASAAVATSLPMAGFGNHAFYMLEGETYARPADYPQAHRVAVTPAFFELFAIPVLQGRSFASGDRLASRPVAIVNRSFADRAWPGQEPVGQRLRLGQDDPGEPWRTVVGLVPDAWAGVLIDDDQAGIYLPYAQTGDRAVVLAVASRGDAAPLAALMRRQAQALDKSLPLYDVRTMAAVLAEERFFFDLFGELMSALGIVTVLLAAMGIYGVNAFAVDQRTAEIGVRMALGAGRSQILRLVLGEGARSLLLGLAIGLALAWLLAPLTGWLLFEVGPRDPATYLGTVLFLSAVALAACWVPARCAARVQPIEALRYE